MADLSTNVVVDPKDESGVETERRSGMSRTQKVIAIIGIAVLAVLGIRMFAGGDHGPGQDTRQEQDGGGHVPPPGVPDH